MGHCGSLERTGAAGTSMMLGFCFSWAVFLVLKKEKKRKTIKAWSFYLFGYKHLSFLQKEMKTHIAL